MAAAGSTHPRRHLLLAGGDVLLFPDVTGAAERVGADGYDDFRLRALRETGCSFCTRLHFGRALPGEERHYVRIAYSGIGIDQIEEGLGRLRDWAARG